MGAELCLAPWHWGVEAYGGPLSVDMQPYGCFIWNVTTSGVHTLPTRSTLPLLEILDPPLVSDSKIDGKSPIWHLMTSHVIWCHNMSFWGFPTLNSKIVNKSKNNDIWVLPKMTHFSRLSLPLSNQVFVRIHDDFPMIHTKSPKGGWSGVLQTPTNVLEIQVATQFS